MRTDIDLTYVKKNARKKVVYTIPRDEYGSIIVKVETVKEYNSYSRSGYQYFKEVTFKGLCCFKFDEEWERSTGEIVTNNEIEGYFIDEEDEFKCRYSYDNEFFDSIPFGSLVKFKATVQLEETEVEEQVVSDIQLQRLDDLNFIEIPNTANILGLPTIKLDSNKTVSKQLEDLGFSIEDEKNKKIREQLKRRVKSLEDLQYMYYRKYLEN